MISVNYITRPWFFDVALELVEELKKKVTLNLILIISERHYDYFEITNIDFYKSGKFYKPEEVFLKHVLQKYNNYFRGANVLCKFEERKETNINNTITWAKLIEENKFILNSDLNLIESLSLADWYLLLRIRNRNNYHIIHDPVPHSGERRIRLEIIRKIYFPFIDYFITYSSYSKKIFKTSFQPYQNKIISLQLPIYKNLRCEVKSLEKKKNINILFFGRISPYKGVELFYEAASLLSTKFKDVTFTIAGKLAPNYYPEFIKENTNKNIRIKNQFLSNEQLGELMSEATFCVLPYHDATQSGVIMTSYAYNVPVLVSDCPGLLEYCFDTLNFSFQTKDLNDLYLKMSNLLENDYLIEKYKNYINNYLEQNVSALNVRLILDTLYNIK